jgi:uridine phosphorylase
MKHTVNFPKYGEKHKLKSILTPKQTLYLVYKNKLPHLPKNVFIVYSRRLTKSFRKELSMKKTDKFARTSAFDFFISPTYDVALVKLGMGAPVTALEIEKAIEMGASKFIIFGSAGGVGEEVEVGDIIVPTKALRDEGLSHHYLKNSLFVEPDSSLLSVINHVLKRNKIGFLNGVTWTTDAPWRETRKEVERYKNKGILTIEMESAALFAVAKARRVKAAALFSISDQIKRGKFSGWPKNSGYAKLTRIAKLLAEELSEKR